MVKRTISFLLLLWMLGFMWFALFLPQPASLVKTDAVVVLTGGAQRIDRGLTVLETGNADHMLISGVDRDVKRKELAAQYPQSASYFDCCIDLGFRAIDTRSNALETSRWVKRHKVHSLRLVTHDWHMRRARLELDKALPADIEILNDAVPTHPTLGILMKEYNKFWLRIIAGWLGI